MSQNKIAGNEMKPSENKSDLHVKESVKTRVTGDINELRQLQAPYFPAFGRKQRALNEKTTDILEILVRQMDHVLHTLETQIPPEKNIPEILVKSDQQLQSMNSWLELISKDTRGNSDWIDMITKQLKDLTPEVPDRQSMISWLNLVAEATRGNSDWITMLDAKLKRLTLEIRELNDAGTTTLNDKKIPPRIVNDADFQKKLDKAKDHILLNIGCGEKPREGYINIDRAELPKVDIVADICNLPFDTESVAEIASEHLIEHFRQQTLIQTILPYWKSLLQENGCLRIVCPNWEELIQQLQDEKISYDIFKEITFGGQDYPGNDHFSMYTPDSLTKLLEVNGFARVEVVTECRMNGNCPEMELIAYP